MILLTDILLQIVKKKANRHPKGMAATEQQLRVFSVFNFTMCQCNNIPPFPPHSHKPPFSYIFILMSPQL